jgi:AcrR family transcriptional regulator
MKKTTSNSRTNYHVGNLSPVVVDAARAMLEEVGLAKLSLRAVSQKVGVSPAAIYHHFSNRGELVSLLAAQGFNELTEALEDRDRESWGATKMRLSFLSYFSFAIKNPALYQLMFGEEFTSTKRTPELQTARERAFGELKVIITEALDINDENTHNASLAAWAQIHGFASLVIHQAIQFPHGTTNEAIVENASRGLESLIIGLNKRRNACD